MNCAHENFTAAVNVGRLTEGEGGPVTGFTADVTVKCADCGVPFRWLGLPMGSMPTEPATSVDGYEMRAPIAPAGEEMPLARIPGFTIRQRGAH